MAWLQRFGGARKTEVGCESVCAGLAPPQAPSPRPPAHPTYATSKILDTVRVYFTKS